MPTSTWFPKIPTKVKISLAISLFQRTMSSQILTGIEKVDNEATAILEGTKFIFSLKLHKGYVCVIFFEGEGRLMMGLLPLVDDGAPVTTADQNFCLLPNWKKDSLAC